ncbi:hypothetical protein EEJ42_14145 [Streptomyces botrytidirepellens]|uniref:PLL-like beta propeller domain-containing protein n=1 Tax=Streptomyces botrytidirepellens TaxID=2486417 RepID=A0A3M8WAB0_9ACTN|nr:hypothetical protein EEJ42_14145 [Streptomyces botrytidirepellens]
MQMVTTSPERSGIAMATVSSVRYVSPFSWVSLNANEGLEVFARGSDGTLQHNWQTAPSRNEWSGWKSLGGNLQGDPVVATNLDARMEAFVRTTDGKVQHAWQTAPHSTSWSRWESLPGNPSAAGMPTVARDFDGRLEVFVRATDGSVQHIWQTAPNNGWRDDWKVLFVDDVMGDMAVIQDSDGRLEAFVRGYDDENGVLTVLHAYQRPHVDGWAFGELGGTPQGDPTAVLNTSGQQEVFVLGPSGSIEHIWQTKPSNGWAPGWTSLGGDNPVGTPAVGVNTDGRLDVFTRQEGGALEHIWQTNPAPDGRWSPHWASLYNGALLVIGDPVVASNADGRLEVFALFGDGTIRCTWQNTPGDDTDWSAWHSLGVPGQ